MRFPGFLSKSPIHLNSLPEPHGYILLNVENFYKQFSTFYTSYFLSSFSSGCIQVRQTSESPGNQGILAKSKRKGPSVRAQIKKLSERLRLPWLPLRFFQTSCGSVRFLTGQTTFSRFCFRSDKHAAVLRLQSTQPKDRRVYTALTGILTEPLALWKNR